MRRAFTYASIGIIILVLFVSNSAVASSFGDDYSRAYTTATQPGNILGSDDDVVCSVGTVLLNDGLIIVLFDDDFTDGLATDDVIIYGLDIDFDTEEYDVSVGNYIDEYTPVCIESIGSSDDTAGIVSFDMDGTEGSFNCIVIRTLEYAGGGGTWPGAEIDAVWVRYD